MARMFLLKSLLEEAHALDNLEKRQQSARIRSLSLLTRDDDYVSIYRLSKELIDQLESDLLPLIKPTKRRGKGLTTRVKILCTLSFLASGSYQKVIKEGIRTYLSQPSASRCINEVVEALNNPAVVKKYIRFPQNQQERQIGAVSIFFRRVGVNNEGEIQYLKNVFYQDNGCSANESISPITVSHFFNCYDRRRWFVEANSVATDTPSNTWCRAPSSTEGLAMIENIMEKIAHKTGKDSLHVKLANMAKDNNPLPELIETLKIDANYNERLEEVERFNLNNRWRKRALKLMPMTYELFYIGPYNSLISIYHGDGSLVITHAGIEMGQGINTKVVQVCGYKLGIPLEKISVKPSSSFTSPNAMTTGASVGSECVAFATMKACDILLERLAPIKEMMKNPTWEELIEEAFKAGIDLQASYSMKAENVGIKPYDVYGVCALEVEVDILTGNHDVLRVDLLEDTGRSLSPKIDIAQIEGAFVMGLGYWTSEKIVYDPESGKLLTDRTWTYKPPGIKDIPADFRVYFRRNSKNPLGVLQSKATGEPALCLASVITHALREAVRSARLDAGYEDLWFDIQNPCTVENIFMSVDHKLEHFILK